MTESLNEVVHSKILDEPLNQERYIELLEELFLKLTAAGEAVRNCVISCDNLITHKTKKVEAFLRKLGLTCIFNPPYHLELNFCEKVILLFKDQVRMRLKEQKVLSKSAVLVCV